MALQSMPPVCAQGLPACPSFIKPSTYGSTLWVWVLVILHFAVLLFSVFFWSNLHRGALLQRWRSQKRTSRKAQRFTPCHTVARVTIVRKYEMYHTLWTNVLFNCTLSVQISFEVMLCECSWDHFFPINSKMETITVLFFPVLNH
jgi:hypothetical protein